LIDCYDFGKVVIDGKPYTADVIIYPNTVKDHWWRKEGHALHIEDIEEVLREKPEVLIVGTGYNGLMRITNEVVSYLESKGIKLITQNTKRACEVFNQLSRSQKVIAVLHLTC